MFLWTAKGRAWSTDSLVDMDKSDAERGDDATFTTRSQAPSSGHKPTFRHGRSVNLNPAATEASSRIILFGLINAGLQLLGYILVGWKLLDVAQRIQPARTPSFLMYLMDVLCLVAAGNGFMIWLHLLTLAYLREKGGGVSGGSGSNLSLNGSKSKDWKQRVKHWLLVKGGALVSSIRAHIFFAIFFETAWTLFLLIDGWAFIHFGLHIFSTTVLHMLMNPEWFLGMAHIDLVKAIQGLIGLALFFGLQGGIYFLSGMLPSRSPKWSQVLQWLHQGPASSKRMLWALPACYLLITSFYLATPIPYQDAASTSLPINYAALLSAFHSGNHESYNLPHMDVEKLGIANKKLTTLHPNLYPQLRHKKNVLMLLGDSLRTDWYRTEYSAKTRDFLSRPHVNYSCSSYPDHYTNGHTTEGGMFSMMYSLWPELNTVKRMEIVGPAASFPLSLLKANGYVLYGFKTGVLGYSYILRHESKAFFGVNQYNHHQDFPNANDEQVVDRVLQWRSNRLLSQKLKNKDSEAERTFEDMSESQRKQIEKDSEGEYYFTVVFLSRAHALAHSTKDPMRYWEATKTYDDNFKRLFDAFRPEIEDGSTALIVSSDHAEMLGENTYYGHGWNSIEQFWRRELLGIPLSICLPNYPNKRKIWPHHSQPAQSQQQHEMQFTNLPHPTSSVDLLPTLLDYFQMDPPVPAKLFSMGKSFFPLSSSSPSSSSNSETTMNLDSSNQCDSINTEQVVAFDNLNGPIDRVALIRKRTLSTAIYNLNDCLLFSQAYHTRTCKLSQTIVSIYNLTTATSLPDEQVAIPYQDRFECMRNQVYRYLSHPLPQLLYAKHITSNPTATTTATAIEGDCLELTEAKQLEMRTCSITHAAQLWVPSQNDEMVNVKYPTCRITPPSSNTNPTTITANTFTVRCSAA